MNTWIGHLQNPTDNLAAQQGSTIGSCKSFQSYLCLCKSTRIQGRFHSHPLHLLLFSMRHWASLHLRHATYAMAGFCSIDFSSLFVSVQTLVSVRRRVGVCSGHVSKMSLLLTRSSGSRLRNSPQQQTSELVFLARHGPTFKRCAFCSGTTGSWQSGSETEGDRNGFAALQRFGKNKKCRTWVGQ